MPYQDDSEFVNKGGFSCDLAVISEINWSSLPDSGSRAKTTIYSKLFKRLATHITFRENKTY